MSAAARKARSICVVSAGIVVLSAFLPWVSVLGFSKSGIQGDGVITLVCAGVGLALVWRGKLGWIGQLAPAVLVILTGLYDLNEAGNLAAIGLYLTFLAGIAWVVGAFMVRARRNDVQAADGGDAEAGESPPTEPDVAPVEPVKTGDVEHSAA